MRGCLMLIACLLGMAQAMAVGPGEVVALPEFKDTWYLPRELKDLGEAEAYVLVFLRDDCAQVDQVAEAVRSAEAEFGPQGAAFVLLDSADADNNTEAAWLALRHQLTFAVAKDWDAACATAVGITQVPSVAVLDAGNVLRYRGGVNDEFRLALAATLAGTPSPTPETSVEGCEVNPAPAHAPVRDVTYAGDVAPILEKKCVSCHRAGGNGPFDLSTFAEVASHANMVAEVVREGRMPPWYPHPAIGNFANDRTLSDEEIAVVRKWVASGKPEGAAAPAPEPQEVTEAGAWGFEPDIIITQDGQSAIPATGFVPYQYVFMHHVFEEDTYVQAIQIKPDNAKVLHHGNLFFTRDRFNVNENTDFLTGTVPGGVPSIAPDGIAWKIPKGANLCLQLHLVTTGKMSTCKMQVGLRFARGKVDKLLYYHNFDEPNIDIPAGERSYQVVKNFKLDDDVSVIGMFSHMHLRGKAMTFEAIYPGGDRRWLMALPNYSFDWQITYSIPPFRDRYPAGTTIQCTAYWDNSKWNPYNPAPEKVVKHGPQTVDEMMNGFFVFTKDAEHLNLSIDPKTGGAAQQLAEAVR